jgi:hypothetical protein
VKKVLAELGCPDQGVSVKQIDLPPRVPGVLGGTYGADESAGKWEIMLNDGTTYNLPLTFKEINEADCEKSDKLKAAIRPYRSRRPPNSQQWLNRLQQ